MAIDGSRQDPFLGTALDGTILCYSPYNISVKPQSSSAISPSAREEENVTVEVSILTFTLMPEPSANQPLSYRAAG